MSKKVKSKTPKTAAQKQPVFGRSRKVAFYLDDTIDSFDALATLGWFLQTHGITGDDFYRSLDVDEFLSNVASVGRLVTALSEGIASHFDKTIHEASEARK